MTTALDHVVERLEHDGWTITHVVPDALVVEGRSMGFFRVHARKDSLVVWVDGRGPRADGTYPIGQGALEVPLFRDHARRSRRIVAENALLFVVVADGAQARAELEAACAIAERTDAFQSKLVALYSERGWALDAKRSQERCNGWDDPAWNVAAERAGDVLEVGLVASGKGSGDLGIVKVGDAGEAHVRTSEMFGVANVYVLAEAEKVLALF